MRKLCLHIHYLFVICVHLEHPSVSAALETCLISPRKLPSFSEKVGNFLPENRHLSKSHIATF